MTELAEFKRGPGGRPTRAEAERRHGTLLETAIRLFLEGGFDAVTVDEDGLEVVGWRRDRVPEFPRGVPIMVRPDWVCEILSASTERIDRVKKMRIYRRDGVAHVWLLNPVSETLEVYRICARLDAENPLPIIRDRGVGKEWLQRIGYAQ